MCVTWVSLSTHGHNHLQYKHVSQILWSDLVPQKKRSTLQHSGGQFSGLKGQDPFALVTSILTSFRKKKKTLSFFRLKKVKIDLSVPLGIKSLASDQQDIYSNEESLENLEKTHTHPPLSCIYI